MRAIIFVAIALIFASVSCKPIDARFVLEVPSLKYSFEGYAHVDIYSLNWLDMSEPMKVPFDGKFKMDDGKEYSAKGMVTIDQPILSHLDQIKVTGTIDAPTKIQMNGIFKVNALDVLKPRIPFNGNLKFTNGKQGDAKGLIDRPTLELEAY